MMIQLIDWVKTHKLSSFLIIVLIFVLASSLQNTKSSNFSTTSVAPMMGSAEFARTDAISAPAIGKVGVYGQSLPPADTQTRMVTTDTNLSLKVDDVSQIISRIESVANQAGGYMINSSLSKPEGAASGTISIRIPADKRSSTLSEIRGLAVKVVSENVNGQDITDQYVDNDERLRILESTKTKFEAILADAKNVQDMMQVQSQLLSLQSQIDAIKGEQKYLEGSAKLTRLTIYLATDELALPYAPDTTWRPTLVFKEAVRSLVLSLRNVGSLAIWILVYSPDAIVLALILWIIKKFLERK